MPACSAGCSFSQTDSRGRSRLSARSVLLPSAEVSTGDPRPTENELYSLGSFTDSGISIKPGYEKSFNFMS